MFFGIESAQHSDTLSAFNVLFNNEEFGTIIEIGPAWGALTIFFGLYGIVHNCEVHSFDINNPWEIGRHRGIPLSQKSITDLKINFSKEDVFSDETSNKIISLIQKPQRCLLLCDGGDKKREFNLFSKHLKSRDTIMAHDYGYNSEVFKQKSKMAVMEITFADISDSCKENNLEFYYSEIFDPVAWVCMGKK